MYAELELVGCTIHGPLWHNGAHKTQNRLGAEGQGETGFGCWVVGALRVVRLLCFGGFLSSDLTRSKALLSILNFAATFVQQKVFFFSFLRLLTFLLR